MIKEHIDLLIARPVVGGLLPRRHGEGQLRSIRERYLQDEPVFGLEVTERDQEHRLSGTNHRLDSIQYQAVSNKLSRVGRKMPRKIGQSNIYHLKLKSGQTVDDVIKSYRYDPEVEFVQPNYIYWISTTAPDDPLFQTQWGLRNSGQTISGSSGFADI